MVSTKQSFFFLVILFACISQDELHGQIQQPEELTLILNKALIDKNSILLDKILNNKLSYGHSNLWIENKVELLENNKNEILKYHKIQTDSIQAIYHGKVCIIRYNAMLTITYQGKDIELKLHVIQTWKKRHNRWQLLARQSVKM